MAFRLLLSTQLLQYCLAGYVAHVYWPRSIIGYYHIPVMQKMRYILPAPEEVGHHLPAAVPVQPPAQHVMTPPDIVDVAPSAVEPAGAVIAHQPYSAAQAVGYHIPAAVAAPAAIPAAIAAPAAVPAPFMITAPSGSTSVGYQATSGSGASYIPTSGMQTAIYGDKQYSNEDSKNRVPKMAIAPGNAPEVGTASTSYESGPQVSYASGNEPETSSYQEKPETMSGYQSEKEIEVAPAEQSPRYTAEDDASRTGYKLRRIMVQ